MDWMGARPPSVAIIRTPLYLRRPQTIACKQAPPLKPAPPADDPPGVPGFRTWREVYWFVLTCFVLVVVALTLFSRYFA